MNSLAYRTAGCELPDKRRNITMKFLLLATKQPKSEEWEQNEMKEVTTIKQEEWKMLSLSCRKLKYR